MIVAVDFDGCLCENRWPEIGAENTALIKKLIDMKKDGAELILWTCRGGERLDEAVEWCRERGLEFDTVNESIPRMIKEFGGKDCRKVYADLYIDDRSAPNKLLNIPYHPRRDCGNCHWYSEDECVCCNGESEKCADFMMPNDGCEQWEGKV